VLNLFGGQPTRRYIWFFKGQARKAGSLNRTILSTLFNMAKTTVSHGDNVTVHYTGRFINGEVFDSSVNREPLSFVIGAGQMIPGFEQAVLGMGAGEAKLVSLEPEEAYGPVNQDYIVVFAHSDFPADMNPKLGDQLMLTLQDGGKFPVVVTNVSDAGITLDGNHPLAGQKLVFEIEVVEIK
jgi:FKBP-type peptidyl-prolyl cis-trans isomerase 2